MYAVDGEELNSKLYIPFFFKFEKKCVFYFSFYTKRIK